MPHSRRILVGVAVAFTVVVVAGAIAIAFGSSGARQHSAMGRIPPPGRTSGRHPSSLATGNWNPVSPATTIPAQTPVQMQYDRGFEHGFSSPSNERVAALTEGVRLPLPTIAGGWPNLPTSNTPGVWTREFVHGLLDINFAHQSRSALGGWLVAEEAPDLMPGTPPAFQLRTLYVSVMDPQITAQASPLPSAAQWQANASAAVRWSVHGLQVQLDPAWQSMIAAGWQPRDLRSSVEDVSGMLTVARGKTTTNHRFSMMLQVGSAHWHSGYGTVLASNWKES